MNFEERFDDTDGGRTFADRREAGSLLADRLGAYRRDPGAVVLGLPRGGVVVAAEIARRLDLPLGVLIARKIGAPTNPELAIGAVAEDGEPWLNRELIELAGATPAWIAAATERERQQIAQRRRIFREGRPLDLPAAGTAIVVDDGVATGATVIAALDALQHRGLRRLVCAIPVAPPDTAEMLRSCVDELVVIRQPVDLVAVGDWYDDFRQVTDGEVMECLRESAERIRPGLAPPAEESRPNRKGES